MTTSMTAEPCSTDSVPRPSGATFACWAPVGYRQRGLASHLKLYPDVPAKRRSTIVRDLVLLGLVVLFAWMGFKVHDAVNSLGVLGSGVKDAGVVGSERL